MWNVEHFDAAYSLQRLLELCGKIPEHLNVLSRISRVLCRRTVMEKPKWTLLTGGIVGLVSIGCIAAQLGLFRSKAASTATSQGVGMIPPPAPATELNRVWKFCLRGEFNSAEAVVAGLPDKELQDQILEIIMFNKARAALSRKDSTGAARIACKLSVSLKRSLILIAVAFQQAAAGDRQSASASLRNALLEGGDLSCRQRSRLLAGVGRVYMRFDAQTGQSVLRRAVAQYRRAAMEVGESADFSTSRIHSTQEGFYEIVRTQSGQTHIFPLHLPSLPRTIVDESILDCLPKEN
jgi:hypothetical protein